MTQTALIARLKKVEEALAKKLEAENAATLARIAELESEVNRLNSIYDEIELRALMAKDSSDRNRPLLERLESNFTELCEARDKEKRRIAELERETAELRRDAERYRWLRQYPVGIRPWDYYKLYTNELDAKIDAAIVSEKESGNV